MTATTQECCEQYWTSSGGSTTESNSCTFTYHPSRKLSKLDELDMQDTAGEVGMKLVIEILLAKVGRPAQAYIQQHCADTGCNPEDLPGAMDDRDVWQERVRDICADGAKWWWWIYI